MRALVVIFIVAAAAPAAAQPGVFGGCPRGPVRAVADDAAIIEPPTLAGAELHRCTPSPVRAGKAKGEPRCVRDDDAMAAGTAALPALAPDPALGHRFIREKGKPWTLVSFRAHGRQVALWRSDTPVDCVGRMFLSPDRRTLVVEVTLSKKFFLDESQTLRVIALRLPRPVR